MCHDRRRLHQCGRMLGRAGSGPGIVAWMSSLAAFGLVGTAPTSAQQSPTAPSPTASLVFDGVTVVDVEQGKLVPSQRVVIANTRIQAIGDSQAVELPTGAQVVDARGKYLMPGLWDVHIHPG